MYLYQKENLYFAKFPEEFIHDVKSELLENGLEVVSETHRGLYFKSHFEEMLKLNYTTRLISKIYAPLIKFMAVDKKDIYKNVLKIKWEEFITPEKTFSVKGHTSNSKIINSHYAALCVKDGIADYFRKKYGKRPYVNKENPDMILDIHIHRNMATLSIDTSLKPLHKRGYRKRTSVATMGENLSAFILSKHPYRGEENLLDPFCGTGTFLAEALITACNIPPGYLREKWGFYNLPEFNLKKWKSLKEKINSRITEIERGKIRGSDISGEEVEKAKFNLSQLPFGEKVILEVKDFRDIGNFRGLIFTNPPYGMRMSTLEIARKEIKEFGDFLKQKCKGSTAYIYLGNRELIKHIGLKTSFKLPLKNGGMDGRLIKILIF